MRLQESTKLNTKRSHTAEKVSSFIIEKRGVMFNISFIFIKGMLKYNYTK